LKVNQFTNQNKSKNDQTANQEIKP
jgi:hypothetical protein